MRKYKSYISIFVLTLILFGTIPFFLGADADQTRTINVDRDSTHRPSIPSSSKKALSIPMIPYEGNTYIMKVLIKNLMEGDLADPSDPSFFIDDKIKVNSAKFTPNGESAKFELLFPMGEEYTVDIKDSEDNEWYFYLTAKAMTEMDELEIPKTVSGNLVIDATTEDYYSAGGKTQINEGSLTTIKVEATFQGKYKYGPYRLDSLKRDKEAYPSGMNFLITEAFDSDYVAIRVNNELQSIEEGEYECYEEYGICIEAKAVNIPNEEDTSKDNITLRVYSTKSLDLDPISDYSDTYIQYGNEIEWEGVSGSGTTKTKSIETSDTVTVNIPFQFKGAYERDLTATWEKNIDNLGDIDLDKDHADPLDPYWKYNSVTFSADVMDMARGEKVFDYLVIYDEIEDVPISRIRVELTRVKGEISFDTVSDPYAGQTMRIQVNEGKNIIDTTRLSDLYFKVNNGNKTDITPITNPFDVALPNETGEVRIYVDVDNEQVKSRGIPIVTKPPTYTSRTEPIGPKVGDMVKISIYDSETGVSVDPIKVKSIVVFKPDGITPQKSDVKVSSISFQPDMNGTYTMSAEVLGSSKVVTGEAKVDPKKVSFSISATDYNSISVKMQDPYEATVRIKSSSNKVLEEKIIAGDGIFEGLADGTQYTIEALAQDYAPNSKSEKTKTYPSVVLEEVLYDKNTNSLRGTYTPEDARVEITDENGNTVQNTYANGSFSSKYPLNGEYTITLTKTGYKKTIESYPITTANPLNPFLRLPIYIWAIIPIVAIGAFFGFRLYRNRGKGPKDDYSQTPSNAYYPQNYPEEPDDIEAEQGEVYHRAPQQAKKMDENKTVTDIIREATEKM